MNRINHRQIRRASPRQHHRRSLLCAAMLTALGTSIASMSAAYAQAYEYTANEVVTEDREHATGFSVGIEGAVVVDVQGSTKITSGGDVVIGGKVDGNGTLRVTGTGSSVVLAPGRDLTLGHQGSGHLSVLNGGHVSAGKLILGDQRRAGGTVHVSGAGSRLEARSINVGELGKGVLRIDEGGVVNVQGTLDSHHYNVLESASNPSGRVEISGAGSLLNADQVIVGSQLLIEAGGTIRSNTGAVKGISAYEAGAAVITGAGTEWINAGVLEIDTGLDVSNGARITTDTLAVSGSWAINRPETDLKVEQLRITGAGSVVSASNGVVIAGFRESSGGTITVSDGGRLEAGGDIKVDIGGYLVFGSALMSGSGWATPVAPGLIDDSTISMSYGSRAVTFNHTGHLVLGNTIRSEPIGNIGSMGGLMNIAGSTTLNGDLREFGGAISVAGGRLEVNSDLFVDDTLSVEEDGDYWQKTKVTGGTFVFNGTSGFLKTFDTADGPQVLRTSLFHVEGDGVFAGNATVGSLWVINGGTLSPGDDGVGKIVVDGDLFLFGAGPDLSAFYDVDVLGSGESDFVKVSGKAHIGSTSKSTSGIPRGSAVVRLTGLDPVTSYQNGQRYTILEADGGFEGGFDDVTSHSAFIVPTLVQTDNAVQLDIALNAEDGDPSGPGTPTPIVFGRVAITSNQIATAAGLDSLHQQGEALALYNHLLMLDEATALEAFDQLSGELHASTRALLLDDRFLREGIGQRLQPDPGMARDGGAGWAAGAGSSRRQHGDGSAAALRNHRQGFMVGYDWTIGDAWTFGAAGGTASLRQTIAARLSENEVDARHGGLYAGFRSGPAWVQAGATYAEYRVETERRFAHGPEGEQLLMARYRSHAVSVFTEGGIDIPLNALTLSPYLALAHTRLSTPAFAEAGGSAALAVDTSKDEVWTRTAGARVAWDISAGQRDMARLEGGLAWQHAAGELRAGSSHRFGVGSQAFTVHGLPLARNLGIAELGVSLKPTDNSRLSLMTEGRFGGGVREFGVQANWRVAF